MIEIVANVSPIIPNQFPTVYRQEGPNLVAFAQAYYKWLEQTNNTLYYARNLYNIHDIDNTLDQFIVYFKEKYLKNLPFTTQTNIRTVVKHALDIYRSKGTERGTTLVFQLAFDETPNFYYPSKDLFKLSDGQWITPQYLELTLQGSPPLNTELQHKEVRGVISGATAFVDNIIRRKTNNRLQDIAYISAVFGQFQTGEKIQPTDGSITIDNCPSITGSLNGILIDLQGSGTYYTIGDIIPVSTVNGNGASIRISNTVIQTGLVTTTFLDGGWGFQSANVANNKIWISNNTLTIANVVMNTANLEDGFYFNWWDTITQPLGTINYINANGAFTSGANLYTYYVNNSVQGTGIVLDVTQTNSTAGVLVIEVWTGSMANTIYTYSNAIAANLAVSNGYTNSTATGNFIANTDGAILNIANAVGTFYEGEQIFQTTPEGRPQVDEKEGGWAQLVGYVNASALSVNSLAGRFIVGPILGIISGATANVVSAQMIVGVVNTTNQFIASQYSNISSPLTTGTLITVNPSGGNLSVQIANSLIYTQNVSINTDLGSTYANVLGNAASYGFPANPSGNASTNAMSCLTFSNQTIGRMANVVLTGFGAGFTGIPFVVIDNPEVSNCDIFDDILEITGTTYQFTPGEVIHQPATGMYGVIQDPNTSFIYVTRMNFSNDFVATTNSTTTIMGLQSGATANILNVDYNYLANPMGRNSVIQTNITSGNNTLLTVDVIDSGFGFLPNEPINIGSNNAAGLAIVKTQGTGTGYYAVKGGFLSDQKKLFDGYYWQNFSYDIISGLMTNKYQKMMEDLMHISGTKLFGTYVHNSYDGDSLKIQNAVIEITGGYYADETQSNRYVDETGSNYYVTER